MPLKRSQESARCRALARWRTFLGQAPGAAFAWVSALIVILDLTGCAAPEPPQSILDRRCVPLSGASAAKFRVVARDAVPLRVAVERHGIGVVAHIASAQESSQSPLHSATSPIEHYGVATLMVDARQGEAFVITVMSRDAREIAGEVCVSADQLRPTDEHRLRAERTFAKAAEATNAQDWPRAFDLYRRAALDFDSMDRLRAAQARHAMSSIAYWHLRDDAAAYVLADWARADFGAQAEPGLRSALLELQAYALLESQRFTPEERRDRVLEVLEKAEMLAKQSRFGARELPRFDILRGFMDFRTGRASQAVALFMGAAQQCEMLSDWQCAARARQNIATIAEEARDYPAALQAYRDALSVLPQDLDPTLSADIWGNYGRLQSKAGLFRQAEQSHTRSIRLHASLGDCDGTRMAIARLGMLLVQVGNVGEGRVYLTRAASLDCRKLIAVAKELSTAEARLGEPAPNTAEIPACVSLPDADGLSEVGKLAVFNALLGLQDALRLEHDPVQADRCLAAAKAYAATARTQLRFANAEGERLLERGKPRAARAAFENGLAIADRAQLPPTHENRSVAYIGLANAALLTNRPREARNFAARALTLGAERGDLRQVTDALHATARSYIGEHADEHAASILKVAAQLIEQVPIDDLDAEQRATWLATQYAVFADLTAVLASGVGDDEARAWEAFEVSEQGRARALRYALSQATDVRSASTSGPDFLRYRELLRRMSELARNARQGGAGQAVTFQSLARLVEAQPERPGPSTLAALRERLTALDATVVEYAVGRGNMLAFVLDGSHIRVVELGPTADIAGAAAELYARVRNSESAPSDVRRAAAELARQVLWPLTDRITTHRVILVPDGELHTIPFAVLPWSPGEMAPLTLEQVELSVMPSTLFITRPDRNHTGPAAAPRFELFGDPIFLTSEWQRECAGAPAQADAEKPVRVTNRRASALPRLPGSEKEIASIVELAKRAPQNEVHEHLRCNATPSALRAAAASSPTLLHIATHGYVDAYRPRLSALILTPEADSSGIAARFGLLDILQMKISSRLVVLSACDTSRGRLLPGEGVLGPAQAFLQAGAASVVASYWRVADAATARFMRAFYRNLLVEHLPAAAALREAQLAAARSGPSYEWAAFTLFGWPDTRL